VTIFKLPSVDLKYLGSAYDFQIKGVRAAGRSEQEVAAAISRVSTKFDCFLINRSARHLAVDSEIVMAIAEHADGWVEVFGAVAEKIHDAVDEASVTIGRQKSVGDGVPMTSWAPIASDEELVAYISTGGQGTSALKLVVCLGESRDEERLFTRLRQLLAPQSG
jgi:hypothetical protein